MTVPKKRTSISKKRIRRNIWRKKRYLTAVKASSLAKSVNSKSFIIIKKQLNNKVFGFGFFVQQPIQSIDTDQNIID